MDPSGVSDECPLRRHTRDMAIRRRERPISTLHNDGPLGELHGVDGSADRMSVDFLLSPPLVLALDDTA
jgi:hypothetical protein